MLVQDVASGLRTERPEAETYYRWAGGTDVLLCAPGCYRGGQMMGKAWDQARCPRPALALAPGESLGIEHDTCFIGGRF